MEIFLQQIVNGLAIGSIYALVAIGYTMVYGVMKLINFAHGDLVALAAYVGLTVLMQAFGMHLSNLWAVILMFTVTAMFISLFGIILERLAYRALRKAP
ncbi:MAG: branched-chain amino acid ABC transporter permease, partial [Desulfurella sp.]|uniref:ABC transporter permease subunit n=1 Tax=Desulfurella sp. TaxID=1962857 RepID=UPI000CABD4CF